MLIFSIFLPLLQYKNLSNAVSLKFKPHLISFYILQYLTDSISKGTTESTDINTTYKHL